MSKVIKILITGSEGFIGKNLIKELELYKNFELTYFNKKNKLEDLENLVKNSDFIIHLAGVNRPKKDISFKIHNSDLTKTICNFVYNKNIKLLKKTPIIFTSSIQVNENNEYAKSKLNAEKHLKDLFEKTSNPIVIFRLPGIFGKWCKPNYNSVVATFCHNISNNLQIEIHDENKNLKLVYIDDLVKQFILLLNKFPFEFTFKEINPEYNIKLKDLADLIIEFRDSRQTNLIPNVGDGFTRKLYSTYLSYFNSNNFTYKIKENIDYRGSFVEMLKTKSAGQFSFFTANPGVIRGGHYHNTKNEKFLVIRGKARFRFRNIKTNECKELFVDDSDLKIVETCPGWTHDIKNIGSEKMYVMLWANEQYDKNNPDTIFSETF